MSASPLPGWPDPRVSHFGVDEGRRTRGWAKLAYEVLLKHVPFLQSVSTEMFIAGDGWMCGILSLLNAIRKPRGELGEWVVTCFVSMISK